MRGEFDDGPKHPNRRTRTLELQPRSLRELVAKRVKIRRERREQGGRGLDVDQSLFRLS